MSKRRIRRGEFVSRRDQIQTFVKHIFLPDDWVETRKLSSKTGYVEQEWYRASELVKEQGRLHIANTGSLKHNIHVGILPRLDYGLAGDKNVTCPRTLFADLDYEEEPPGGFLKDVQKRLAEVGLPAPTVIVLSGHGVHVYYVLAEVLEISIWREIQRRIIKTLGADDQCVNPERLLRLPGFVNWKEKEGFPRITKVKLVEGGPSRKYTLDELEDHLKPLDQDDLDKLSNSSRNSSSDENGHHDPGAGDDHHAGYNTKYHPNDGAYAEAVRRAKKYIAKFANVSDGRKKLAYMIFCILLTDFALKPEDAWAIACEWNQGNTPPLHERELKQTSDNAAQYSKGEPGSKLKNISKQPQQQERVILQQDLNALAQYVSDIQSGKITVASFPWPLLTQVTRALQSRTITLLVGAPGSCKTWMIIQWLLYWIEKEIPFACFMLEEALAFHGLRALAACSGRPEITDHDWVKDNLALCNQIQAEHKDIMDKLMGQMWTPDAQPPMDQIADWIEDKARAGKRIICVDPISVAKQGQFIWQEEKTFLSRVGKICEKHDVSIILVTHPKTGFNSKQKNGPSMDSIAGSAPLVRLCQTILYLEQHHSPIDRRVTTIDDEIKGCELNRTLTVLKARNGKGAGLIIGLEFDESNLGFNEEGIIIDGD